MNLIDQPVLLALPMHGESKLRLEGLRTRDGHTLEWFSKLRPQLPINVHSRPEPWPRVTLGRRFGQALPPNWICTSPQPLAIPPIRDRRRWWVVSRRFTVSVPDKVAAAVVWNPMSPIPPASKDFPIVFDLLDNWLVHPEFQGIKQEVEKGYGEWFDIATVVTANSEGTLRLARSYGRTDATLMLNGCDPHRFSIDHAVSDAFVIGYGGKISERLDTELIAECAKQLPDVRFEFAGPVLSRRTKRKLKGLSNVCFLGDVPYPKYPSVLTGWDIAWVPHLVGDGEVGGDVIKIYEYRAAGLPTVTTKIIGWERAPAGVYALDRGQILELLAEFSAAGPGLVPRDPYRIPREQTWRFKAEEMLLKLGL